MTTPQLCKSVHQRMDSLYDAHRGGVFCFPTSKVSGGRDKYGEAISDDGNIETLELEQTRTRSVICSHMLAGICV